MWYLLVIRVGCDRFVCIRNGVIRGIYNCGFFVGKYFLILKIKRFYEK